MIEIQTIKDWLNKKYVPNWAVVLAIVLMMIV